MTKRGRSPNNYATNNNNSLEPKRNAFINRYLARALEMKAHVTKLNTIGKRNGLKFNAARATNFNGSNRDQVVLAMVNNKGTARAWLAVQPKILKRNGKILTYFTLGRSNIQGHGYGLLLRALANRIGRDVGSQGSNQWAVNINFMAKPGAEPPSAGIMRRLGAEKYTHPSPGRDHGVHFTLPKTRSQANKVLAKKFGIKIPTIPRTFKNQFQLLAAKNISKNAMNKHNAHEFLIRKISDPAMMNAINRAKRRVSNNRISPYNLMKIYEKIFNNKAAAINIVKNKLAAKKLRMTGASPVYSIRRRTTAQPISFHNFVTSRSRATQP
jgi:hypothetical protein